MVFRTDLTNSVGGEFDDFSNRYFKLRLLGTTYVNAPEWSSKFSVAVLRDSVPFKFSSERLRIYFDNGRQSATLIRE